MNEKKLAFKVGFLMKLAELGVLPSELEPLAKKALDITDLASTASGLGEKALTGGLAAGALGGKLLAGTAVGAPLLIGGATGAADAMLSAPSDEDLEALQAAELLGTYGRLTREIKTRLARKAQHGEVQR